MRSVRALLVSAIAILAGCQDVERTFVGSLAQAERVAARAGFQGERYPAGQFELLGFERFAAGPAATLIVYLESDGFIRTNRTTLSSDPTPLRPLTLEMAAQDDSPKLLYLARPCQYQSAERLRGCSPLYWDVRRFSPEVVAGLSQALDRAKIRARAQRLVLIGYSGGGTLAALLAARRDDVDAIATIAAPLDVDAWVRHHAISPVEGALDAAALTALGRTRQIHVTGTDDWQVPPNLTGAYLRRLPAREQVRLVEMPRHNHDCCWVESWPGLLAREVRPWLAAAPAR
jgi:hypothetical protein